MQLAFIHAMTPGSIDVTLNAVVARLRRDGHRVVGVLHEPSTTTSGHRCDMDLIEIASGDRRPANQKLGAGSTGCRLDPEAVECVAGRVLRAVCQTRVDLLVINRFGKLEAQGRGFCPVIVESLARGIPVLVGVNDLNRAAFETFADGLACELPNTVGSTVDWISPLLRQTAACG